MGNIKVNQETKHSLLSTIAAHLSDAVFIANKHYIIEYLNKEALQLSGLGEDEVIGKNFMHLLQGYDNGALPEEIQAQLTKRGEWNGKLDFPDSKKGKYKLQSAIISAAENGNSSAGYIFICKTEPNSVNQISQHDKQASLQQNEIVLSEQKWRTVLNSSRGAIFLVDTDFNITLVNDRAEKLLTHSSRQTDHNEKIYFPSLLPEDKQEATVKILNQVLKGEKEEFEVSYIKSNKELIWLLASCMPVKNISGEINQVCITTYNITATKEKEAALFKSEQRWKFALDGAGDGVWEYNFQTKESYYSPLYKKMLGFSEDEFLNKAHEWQTRVHPEDFHKISNIDDLYENGTIENHAIEYRLKNKTGEYVWVLDRGMVLERTTGGKPLKLIGTHTNITERKLSEEKLAKSEKRFVSFMNNTPTLTWIIDENNVFRYLNASSLHAFRLTEEAIGKTVHEVFPKQICDCFIANNYKVWEENTAFEATEENLCPDGLKRVFHIYKFPLDPENDIRMLGGVALDITKKTELEKQLAAEEVQKKRDIIQAIINAQEKERKEISYELHDNVNQILTSSKLMLEVAVEKPEMSREFTLRCLEYLSDAIAEIRKISHSLTPAALRDISLEAAIEDVVENINKTGKLKIEYYKSVKRLDKSIEPEKQLAILRIIQEQFNNILKHAGASEVTISLITRNTSLFLEIQDNGCGFEPEHTKKGLGLNNMFNRVEYYHGKIQITSSPGKGCTLKIEIPV